MDPILAQDSKAIKTILDQTVNTALHYFENQSTMPPSLDIPDLPYTQLPEYGIGASQVLSYFETHHAQRMANSAGPRYFGFVTGGSTPASVAGDWLVSVYDQVMSGSNDSVAHAIERQTIQFLIQLFGLTNEFTGTFVTGATMSNFVSLATARQWVGLQHGVDISDEGISSVPVKIFSATPHSSIFKSMSMLGLGRKAMTLIDTLPGREAIDLAKLEESLQNHEGPSIVVANAGTVNTVDFDDLEGVAALKSKYNFWLHVDAAFGGFAAASEKYAHLVKGLELADTVTVDAHKWLNVPYDSAMQFTRHRPLQVRVFQNNAAYLGQPSSTPDSMHLTPENSRRFRALPAWFTMLAYGRAGYREIVERNCSVAKHLAELVSNSVEFRLLSPVRMNVVCFTLSGEVNSEEIQRFLNAVRDDGEVFFTPTVWKGTPAIRAAISNWQTTASDVKIGFDALQRIRNNMVPVGA